MNPGPVIDTMRETARVLAVGGVRDKLRAVQTAQDALDAAKALLLAELEVSRDYELDGSSTLNMWARTQLRLNAGQAATLVRNNAALRDLPLVAEAAVGGLVSAGHVRVFVYGLAQVGLEPMRELEDVLVQVAKDHEPGVLFEAVKHLKNRIHSEDLDDAWLKGMDKQDFHVAAVPDGFHVTGFLNTVTGAKLKKVLDSVSAPRDRDDIRSGSERRVQGLDDLLSRVLGGGLPSDKGVKPHLSVFVDADTLQAAAEHVQQSTGHPYRTPTPMPDHLEPATLAGHGPIGPNLLMYFMCVSEFTAFLMKQPGGDRQAQVLNAGRSRYQPNLKQRRSVIARQHGICATPGCHHTHLEIHHSIWWSNGGPTDLDHLIGLCVRCHHLLHRGRLHITGNAISGYHFTNHTGRPLHHRRRRTSHHTAA